MIDIYYFFLFPVLILLYIPISQRLFKNTKKIMNESYLSADIAVVSLPGFGTNNH